MLTVNDSEKPANPKLHSRQTGGIFHPERDNERLNAGTITGK